ncbi:WD repeat-containing protein 89 [Physocladia obscura]|uniref:WD repeat-containing protein 89 n=1 Tax=Physocladia obscura TaxID=109957 RepID=A0AAD5T729_9FUNG|nr:WD repeat-containing protein 89 [Physocladia obscura]
MEAFRLAYQVQTDDYVTAMNTVNGGQSVATGSSGDAGTVRITDVTTQQLSRILNTGSAVGDLCGLHTRNNSHIATNNTVSENAGSNNAILFVAGRAGVVSVFDLRVDSSLTPSLVLPSFAAAPLVSLACNASGSVLAAGAELAEKAGPDGEDIASLLMWDIRNAAAPLAHFIDSHSDDITQLRFHPFKDELLISGSTDGLINLYELTPTLNEEDSLYQVIKANSINKLGFFGPQYEYIFAQTHIETFSLYKFENGDVVKEFGDCRRNVAGFSVGPIEYLVDSAYDENTGRLYIVAGRQDGNMAVLNVGLDDMELVYTLNGGHRDIVRCAYWDMDKHFIMSGGEDGKQVTNIGLPISATASSTNSTINGPAVLGGAITNPNIGAGAAATLAQQQQAAWQAYGAMQYQQQQQAAAMVAAVAAATGQQLHPQQQQQQQQQQQAAAWAAYFASQGMQAQQMQIMPAQQQQAPQQLANNSRPVAIAPPIHYTPHAAVPFQIPAAYAPHLTIPITAVPAVPVSVVASIPGAVGPSSIQPPQPAYPPPPQSAYADPRYAQAGHHAPSQSSGGRLDDPYASQQNHSSQPPPTWRHSRDDERFRAQDRDERYRNGDSYMGDRRGKRPRDDYDSRYVPRGASGSGGAYDRGGYDNRSGGYDRYDPSASRYVPPRGGDSFRGFSDSRGSHHSQYQHYSQYGPSRYDSRSGAGAPRDYRDSENSRVGGAGSSYGDRRRGGASAGNSSNAGGSYSQSHSHGGSNNGGVGNTYSSRESGSYVPGMNEIDIRRALEDPWARLVNVPPSATATATADSIAADSDRLADISSENTKDAEVTADISAISDDQETNTAAGVNNSIIEKSDEFQVEDEELEFIALDEDTINETEIDNYAKESEEQHIDATHTISTGNVTHAASVVVSNDGGKNYYGSSSGHSERKEGVSGNKNQIQDIHDEKKGDDDNEVMSQDEDISSDTPLEII